jgi:6,7-dimethyl-8-ribityllumazine synthase
MDNNPSIAIVAARWNERFTDELLKGAIDVLADNGLEDSSSVFRCPGSFELPQVAAKIADSSDYDAIICLGVLIRGETPHFDYICEETTRGIGAVSRDYQLPVTFGVLTCDTMEQAMARSGSKAGNKGREATEAAVDMLELFDEIEADG